MLLVNGVSIPVMDVALRQNKSSLQKQDQQEHGSQGICYHQIPGQSADRAEKSDCIVVDQESEQPEHEKSPSIYRQGDHKVPAMFKNMDAEHVPMTVESCMKQTHSTEWGQWALPIISRDTAEKVT